MSWLSLVPAALGVAVAFGWLLNVFVRMNAAPTVLAPMMLAAVLNDRRDQALAICAAAPGAPFCRAAKAVLVAENAMEDGDVRARLAAIAGAALASERHRLSIAGVFRAYSVVLLTLCLVDAVVNWQAVAWAGGLALLGVLTWYGSDRLVHRVVEVTEAECGKLVDALARVRDHGPGDVG